MRWDERISADTEQASNVRTDLRVEPEDFVSESRGSQLPMTPKTDEPAAVRNKVARRRVVRALALYCVVPYLTICVLFTLAQRSLMYRPTPAADLSVATIGINANSCSDVEIPIDSETTLRGWLMTPSSRSDERKLVIYFPGNSLNRYERFHDVREIVRGGFDVLIFDYRGFGDSDGHPTEASLEADAKLIWKYATETLGFQEQQIALYGESLGGAVLLSLWSDVQSHPKAAGIVLNSTFTSMNDVAAWQFPAFPFRWLILDRWPSIERIGRVECPTVVFHGDHDEIVPIDHGRRLAAAAREGTFHLVADGIHNEVPSNVLLSALRSVWPE